MVTSIYGYIKIKFNYITIEPQSGSFFHQIFRGYLCTLRWQIARAADGGLGCLPLRSVAEGSQSNWIEAAHKKSTTGKSIQTAIKRLGKETEISHIG